jgi:hypothetical protein
MSTDAIRVDVTIAVPELFQVQFKGRQKHVEKCSVVICMTNINEAGCTVLDNEKMRASSRNMML